MRLAGHFGFSMLVFVDTPTGTHCGPPSTSVRGGNPLRGAAALGSLRSPSLRRPPKGVGQNKAKQFTETLLHRQKELPFPAALLASGRQNHRSAFRPNRGAQWLLFAARVSRGVAPDWFSRSPNRQVAGVPDQQLHRTGADDCSTLSLPLASRTVLQVDQTAFANQSHCRPIAIDSATFLSGLS